MTTAPVDGPGPCNEYWGLLYFPRGEHARSIRVMLSTRVKGDQQVKCEAERHYHMYREQFEKPVSLRHEPFQEPQGWSIGRTIHLLQAYSALEIDIERRIRDVYKGSDKKLNEQRAFGFQDARAMNQGYGHEIFLKTLWYLDNPCAPKGQIKGHKLGRVYRKLDNDTKLSLTELRIDENTYTGDMAEPFNRNRFTMELPSADTFESHVNDPTHRVLNVFDAFKIHLTDLVELRKQRRHWAKSDLRMLPLPK